MSLYCFHLHAYHISFWFFFILYSVLNSVLLYSLLIRAKSYFLSKYLYLFLSNFFLLIAIPNMNSITQSSLVNLMPHYDTRRQWVRYNSCYPNRKYTTSVFGMHCDLLRKRFAPGHFAPMCLIFVFSKGNAQLNKIILQVLIIILSKD